MIYVRALIRYSTFIVCVGGVIGLPAFAQVLHVPGGTVGTSSNSNVGVGTSNPSYKLSIESGNSSNVFRARADGDFIFTLAGDGILGNNLDLFSIRNNNTGIVHLNTLNGALLALGVSVNSTPGSTVASLAVGSSGNVGIGTTSPLQRLSVIGAANATALFNVGKEGDYYGSWMGGSQGNDPHVWVGDWYSAGGGLTWDSSAGKLLLDTYSSSQDLIIANNGGNVGIGTTNSSHKLSVNGTIRAKEIIVDTGWADYVFADNYRLAPLAEVEAHIREHRHLPGIPSATEVAERGVSLGEMQSRILAKVEELTLHLIELKKENQELRRELESVRAQTIR